MTNIAYIQTVYVLYIYTCMYMSMLCLHVLFAFMIYYARRVMLQRKGDVPSKTRWYR